MIPSPAPRGPHDNLRAVVLRAAGRLWRAAGGGESHRRIRSAPARADRPLGPAPAALRRALGSDPAGGEWPGTALHAGAVAEEPVVVGALHRFSRDREPGADAASAAPARPCLNNRGGER